MITAEPDLSAVNGLVQCQLSLYRFTTCFFSSSLVDWDLGVWGTYWCPNYLYNITHTDRCDIYRPKFPPRRCSET